MGSVCLSSASTLRCASLSRNENIVLIIPPVLEVIFSSSLIFMKWGSGRYVASVNSEGWVYLLLAMMQLIANITPAVRDNLTLFRNFDLGIGVASFVPIFLYTFFLYLFTKSELIKTLPRRIKRGSRLILFIFIPAIVIFNEVASFVGVSIRQVTIARRSATIVVGFIGKREEELWTFFTAITLVLLTLFQAIVFSITFFRLFQALGHQRRIEDKNADMAHLIKGAAWISAAAKLGAIETVVGFGGGGFGVSMTRRILRLLSRACLCIGLVKGLDSVEDFRGLQSEILGFKNSKQEWRGSRLRQFISNPRLSTFRQLSPTATAFHAIPRAPSALLGAMNSNEKSAPIPELTVPRPIPSRANMNPIENVARRKSKLEKPRPRNSVYSNSAKSLRILDAQPTMEQFISLKEKASQQRVTVLYNGGAPTLHMRFSTLDVLNPDMITDKLSSRAPSTWDEEVYGPGYDRKSGFGIGYVEKLKKDDEETVSDKDSAKGFFLGPTYEALKPPQPVYNRDSVSTAASHTGPVEIVNTPRRTISVTKAPQAMVYRTSRAGTSPIEEEPGSILPAGLQAVGLNRRPTDSSLDTISEKSSRMSTRRKSSVRARAKSVSVASQADSIQAVHDLAAQFPGPPTLSPNALNTLPEEPTSTAASTIAYPEVIILPRPPTTLSELGYNRNRDTVSEYVDDEVTVSWGNSQHSSFALTPMATRAVDMVPDVPPLTQEQKEMATPRGKPLDPFVDTDSDAEAPGSRPRYIVPLGQPLREALDQGQAIPSSIPSAMYGQRKMSVPEGMLEALSGFPSTNRQSPSGSDNPYMDLGTALDSGKSRLFRSMQQPSPRSGGGVRIPDQPTGPSGTVNDEKLARTAQWVGSTGVVVSSSEMEMSPEEQNRALLIQPAIRSASLQNLHDRGKSIDSMTIGWLKGVDRKQTTGTGLSFDQQSISRVKSVGKAPRKSTPTPIHTRGHSKVSMHLEPIIIPPRSNLNMQVILQSGDIGATPTPSATAHGEEDIVEVKRI
ncbi:hypothetical protein CVT24_006654 [Panaeolus cyanescens]|uniref:Uncharacterized protein n=1 Tax=Panaeolus cyanescens TaxID=181874 RepID=A0A409YSF7_9AGAR|nr:hypothetical protein CVT24_006654 [Panaeolus cyanescens]